MEINIVEPSEMSLGTYALHHRKIIQPSCTRYVQSSVIKETSRNIIFPDSTDSETEPAITHNIRVSSCLSFSPNATGENLKKNSNQENPPPLPILT